ncbi:hypothetical protein NDU88_005187 [Pleurodeles waltl]|uniref:Uncharacterized protein n=1 Tax=Pleurodeles waltl TaxID=8319 RepID=A0AAV7RIC1_PLEWA|nr:hypothetical protein NDU88_005187 [Pleurodeles waltl]
MEGASGSQDGTNPNTEDLPSPQRKMKANFNEEEYQIIIKGQKTPGDQPVCDAQPVEDPILPPLDEDTFQQLLGTFDTSSPELARQYIVVGSPVEPKFIGRETSTHDITTEDPKVAFQQRMAGKVQSSWEWRP